MPKPKYSILDHRVMGWYVPWMMKGLKPTPSPLEQKIRLMQRLGYDGVGLNWAELVGYYQERGPLEQLRALSRELNFPFTAFSMAADGWAFGDSKARQN